MNEWEKVSKIHAPDGGLERIKFNLTGVDNPWAAVSRAAGYGEGATDWELLQIKQMPEIWDRITWFQNGNIVPNPFK